MRPGQAESLFNWPESRLVWCGAAAPTMLPLTHLSTPLPFRGPGKL
jgi:hypothetical protein